MLVHFVPPAISQPELLDELVTIDSQTIQSKG